MVKRCPPRRNGRAIAYLPTIIPQPAHPNPLPQGGERTRSAEIKDHYSCSLSPSFSWGERAGVRGPRTKLLLVNRLNQNANSSTRKGRLAIVVYCVLTVPFPSPSFCPSASGFLSMVFERMKWEAGEFCIDCRQFRRCPRNGR